MCMSAQLYFCFFLTNFSKCYFWNSVKHEVVLCEIQPVGFIHGMRSQGHKASETSLSCDGQRKEHNN